MFKSGTVIIFLLVGFLFFPDLSLAQNGDQTVEPVASRAGPSLDEQIAMLRSDLRANRKQVIAANMTLTPEEAEKFWPTYDQYVNELVQINNAKYALIKQYLQNTNMTDEEADRISKKWVEVDAAVVQLRLKYIPIFRKVLSAKGTAMFFQIDRRVQMMIDLQLASQLPLVQP